MELKDVNLKAASIAGLAALVVANWKNRYFGAEPYLAAMFSLGSINDSYGMDSGRSVVAYFLSNARGWKGEVAKAVKAELNARLKAVRA